MSDELPFSDSNYRPRPPVATPGHHLWTLRKSDRVLRCELRDDSRAGGYWDLQLFDGDGLHSTYRRATEHDARDSAEYVKITHLRDGWADV